MQVELQGRDSLKLVERNGKTHLQVNGCERLRQVIQTLIQEQGLQIKNWQVRGTDHAELLVKKLIFQMTSKPHPYKEDEVCHCRNISLEVIEQSIINGAHTIQAIRRTTTANTACGSCQSDVEAILDHWLR